MPVAAGMSVARVLRSAPFDALDNRLLVAHCLRLSREQLITRAEQCLSAPDADLLNAAFARRQAGEPVAYIL
ncbi:MAG: peptide chain release factor N(5)-glutamine methyltransferase, partial [Herminiimonas sp.]|nr:peptide chain release factor N(5)-glutamine methyltransferase [Herminiimonas sp.]